MKKFEAWIIKHKWLAIGLGSAIIVGIMFLFRKSSSGSAPSGAMIQATPSGSGASQGQGEPDSGYDDTGSLISAFSESFKQMFEAEQKSTAAQIEAIGTANQKNAEQMAAQNAATAALLKNNQDAAAAGQKSFMDTVTGWFKSSDENNKSFMQSMKDLFTGSQNSQNDFMKNITDTVTKLTDKVTQAAQAQAQVNQNPQTVGYQDTGMANVVNSVTNYGSQYTVPQYNSSGQQTGTSQVTNPPAPTLADKINQAGSDYLTGKRDQPLIHW